MDIVPSRLGYFILIRLAAEGHPPSRGVLDQTLKPYFADRLGLSDGGWRTLLANTLEELAGSGWIEERPYRLTAAGWSALKDFLGIDEFPADGKWLSIRNRYLMARALDLLPASPAQLKRLGTSAGLRAAVLVKHYKLPVESLPTLEHALDVLAEEELSPGPEIDPRTSQSLGRDERLRLALIPDQPGDVKVCLPAFVMKARNNTVEALRQAVINRWLNGCDGHEYRFLTESHQNAEDSPGVFDLKVFADQVHDLAQSERGRFGGNKVFLSRLWRRYLAQPGSQGMTRAQFDEYLLEANRQNLITLSRADLISELDLSEVEDSEIALPHATFHFIRTDVAPSETKCG